jgi:hypothetical protein
MKQYVWSERADSGILIESVYRYRADLVEKRPAIMLKRNGYRNNPIGFSGQSFGSGFAVHQNEKGAFEYYTTLFVGSHTLFCIHGTGASTEMLATEVQGHLIDLMPVIRSQLGLRQFTVTEVGAIQELEESSENYVIPLTVGWCYEHNWRLKKESLPLQGVSLASIFGPDYKVSIASEYQGP